MDKNNTKGCLSSIFTGVVTGAANGVIFASSVNYISDLFKREAFALPEILLNGFTMGLMPACAMTGAIYLGTKAVGENIKPRSFATTHIAALLISASVATSYDLGSTNQGFSNISGSHSSGANIKTITPLLDAISRFAF